MGYVPDDVGAWLRGLADAEELRAVVDHLVALHDRNLAASTLVSKLIVLRRAHRALAPAGLLDVTEPALRTWWRNLGYQGLANPTKATNLAHLRAFYRWAIREELRGDDPTRRIDAPKLDRTLPRPVDPAQLVGVLEQLDGDQWRAFALAVYAGMRAMEIARARPGDLSIDDAGQATIRILGKGRHTRTVPIPLHLAEVITGLPAGATIVTTRYGRPFTAAGMSDLLAKILRDHGVEATGHQLRHTFATRYQSRSGDLLTTQRALGHRSPSSTAVYAELDPAALRATAAQVWSDLGADNPDSWPDDRAPADPAPTPSTQ